jgi:catechol 2,3-dioxygenase-like lactoylglutathione lyase family enzyme
MSIEFDRVKPIFRIFSIDKAKEFYVDFLGFNIDWEHRFDESAPLYRNFTGRSARRTTRTCTLASEWRPGMGRLGNTGPHTSNYSSW